MRAENIAIGVGIALALGIRFGGDLVRYCASGALDGYAGPPVQMDTKPNPLGDTMILQHANAFHPELSFTGRHMMPAWSQAYQRMVACVPVTGHEYANMADYLAGKRDWLAYGIKDHPKLGRRGCWHIVGFLAD